MLLLLLFVISTKQSGSIHLKAIVEIHPGIATCIHVQDVLLCKAAVIVIIVVNEAIIVVVIFICDLETFYSFREEIFCLKFFSLDSSKEPLEAILSMKE